MLTSCVALRHHDCIIITNSITKVFDRNYTSVQKRNYYKCIVIVYLSNESAGGSKSAQHSPSEMIVKILRPKIGLKRYILCFFILKKD